MTVFLHERIFEYDLGSFFEVTADQRLDSLLSDILLLLKKEILQPGEELFADDVIREVARGNIVEELTFLVMIRGVNYGVNHSHFRHIIRLQKAELTADFVAKFCVRFTVTSRDRTLLSTTLILVRRFDGGFLRRHAGRDRAVHLCPELGRDDADSIERHVFRTAISDRLYERREQMRLQFRNFRRVTINCLIQAIDAKLMPRIFEHELCTVFLGDEAVRILAFLLAEDINRTFRLSILVTDPALTSGFIRHPVDLGIERLLRMKKAFRLDS